MFRETFKSVIIRFRMCKIDQIYIEMNGCFSDIIFHEHSNLLE